MRDEIVSRHGILTLRFTNDEIGAFTEECLEKIISTELERVEFFRSS